MTNLNYDELIKKKEIHLEDRGLFDDDLDVLIKVIEQSTVLEKLYLDNRYWIEEIEENRNKLTLADGKFAKAIAKNTTLKKLSLSYNNISLQGIELLANALKENNTLQGLLLGGSNYRRIDDEGAKCIAEMLADNETLQELWLQQ